MSLQRVADTAAAGLPPVSREVGRQRTSDRVYDELAAAIRDLRLPPGASLAESELAVRFGVSRTPVREALARLDAAGLVSVVPQVGTRVELIRMGQVRQARFLRGSLEAAAFTQACRPESRDVSGLRALLDEQERCCERQDLDGFFAADEALHAGIFGLAGFPGAWQFMQPAKMHLDRVRRLSLPDLDTVCALIREHTAIVDALEAGDVCLGWRHIDQHAGRVLEMAPSLRAQHPGYFAE